MYVEQEEERYELVKVREYYWIDYCHMRRDVCTYCWTRWFHGEPCVFLKRILIMDGNKIKIYSINRKK